MYGKGLHVNAVPFLFVFGFELVCVLALIIVKVCPNVEYILLYLEFIRIFAPA